MKKILFILIFIPFILLGQTQDQVKVKTLIVDEYFLHWNGSSYDTISINDLKSIYGSDGQIQSDRVVDVGYWSLGFKAAQDWYFTSGNVEYLGANQGIHFTLGENDTIQSPDSLLIAVNDDYGGTAYLKLYSENEMYLLSEDNTF